MTHARTGWYNYSEKGMLTSRCISKAPEVRVPGLLVDCIGDGVGLQERLCLEAKHQLLGLQQGRGPGISSTCPLVSDM